MKKLTLILTIIIITSCSSYEEESFGIFKSPNWLQGVWKDDLSGSLFIFTRNDIKYVTTTDQRPFSFSRDPVEFNKEYRVETISSTPNLYIVDFFPAKERSIIRFIFVKKSDLKIQSKGHLSGSYTKI